MLITTDGIVIRERSVGENDKFIDVLTRDLGVIEISTKGVKKITGKNSAAAQLFAYSKFCILKKNNRYILNSSEPIKSFYELRLDLEKLTIASYFAEIIKFSVLSEEPSYSVLRLFLNTLHFLSNGERSIKLLKFIFEMRIMCEIGLMPDLVACKICICYENEKMFFISSKGSLICGDCLKNEAEDDVFPLNGSSLHAMRFVVFSELEKVFSFTANDKTLDEVCEASENYLSWQLGRSFKTLEFFKSL